MEIKNAREIENLKLMHSQELYILKKRDKKATIWILFLNSIIL